MSLTKYTFPAWIWLALALVLLGFSVTGESLWIDEARTWRYASLNDFSQWLEKLVGEGNSESQMPGFLLGAWLAGKMVGLSEWGLRAQNYLWGGMALLFFWRALSRSGLKWMVLILALHPFFWFYMDEARPYAMQIALGAWLLDWLLRIPQMGACSGYAVIEWMLIGLLLCSSSMLGVLPFAAATGLACWLFYKSGMMPVPSARVGMATGFVLFAMLGAWYLRTLLMGSGGAKMWTPSLFNLAYIIYEFSGAAAFGPGRTELRAAMADSAGHAWNVVRNYIPQMTIWALIVGSSVIFASRGCCEERRHAYNPVTGVALCVVFVAGSLFAAAMLVGFPFWGRHLSPLLPWVCWLVALGLGSQSKAFRQTRKRLGIALVVLFFLGCVQIRWGARHQKEDYAGATSTALQAMGQGRVVWWLADPIVADYYGLKSTEWPEKFFFVRNPTRQQWPGLMPDLVFLSKPEDFDRSGEVRKQLKESGYLPRQSPFNHFEIWEAPAKEAL
jgi:hypothetical protein